SCANYRSVDFAKQMRRSPAEVILCRERGRDRDGVHLVDNAQAVASIERLPPQPAPPNMIWIPGGTFRMGSDRHYPEEAPVHRVAVGGFWIDHTPVTNRQFKEFVRATGHKTFAEVPPDPKDYPGSLPHLIFAGSLVFTPPKHSVDLRDWSQWWTL